MVQGKRKYVQNAFRKNFDKVKRAGMVVRKISKGDVNRSVCAKEGSKNMVLSSIMYGVEVIGVTRS